MPGVIDSEGFPHIIQQIFENAPRESLMALRMASRAFRDAADHYMPVAHLAVDPRSRSRRLALRTPAGGRIPALWAYETLFDPGLGEDSQAPILHLAPAYPIHDYAFDPSKEYLWVVDKLWDKCQHYDEVFSEYVPSEDGMESDGDDDMDIHSSDSQGYEDAALRREMIIRSNAELDEIEACPKCQKWEAAALASLEREGELAALEIQYQADLRMWFQQHKNATRMRAAFPDNPGMWPQAPPRPEKPAPMDGDDDMNKYRGLHEHEHSHEAANRSFWSDLAVTERKALESFAKTVSRTRVVDVHGPSLLHDLAAFPDIEIMRYFGYPAHSPAWWEYRARTTVRFIDIVPPTPEGWSRAIMFDVFSATEVHIPADQGPPRAFTYYDERSLSPNPAFGDDQKRWVTAIKYHPAHRKLSACHFTLHWGAYPPGLEEEVAIMIPDTSEPPVDVSQIEDPTGPEDPRTDNEHMYDTRYVPKSEEVTREFGPLSWWFKRTVHWNQLPEWDGDEPKVRPRLTVVGLCELGNAALGLGDDCSASHAFPDFAQYDTEQRAYALLGNWIGGLLEYELSMYPEAERAARRTVRFLSHDEYRQEVGDWQYQMETVE